MCSVSAASPTPRRVATPRWLDVRLVLGVVLVLGSVLAGALIVSRAHDTHPVVTVTRSLAAGSVLREADLTTTQVRLPGDGRGVYVRTVKDAVGRALVRPVTRGEILPVAAISAPRPGETVTVPFASGAAPTLHRGERIEIWVSTKTCASVVLLPDVVVQDVHADTGSFTSGSGGQDVVVSVDPAVAGRVAAALGLDQAVFRAGVLSGAAPTATPTPAAPSVPGGLPADLAACAPPSAAR